MHRYVTLPAALLVVAGSAIAQAQDTVIVDVVPEKLAAERAQNSEPSIAVNPSNPQQILISAFGSRSTRNPVLFSGDGGATWSVFQYTTVGDQSLAWSDAGIAYIAELAPGASQFNVDDQGSPAAKHHRFKTLPKGRYKPAHPGPDQPWVDAVTVGGADHVYVAFNDLSQRSGRTASVRFSLNGGRTWTRTVIERVAPAGGADLSAVRVKAIGARVYAAFERPIAANGVSDPVGDVVIVRDDAAGANGFDALGQDGALVASNETLPQGSIGLERLGSDLAIAVDPNDADRVVVAYAAVSRGRPLVVLELSTNGGSNWTEPFDGPSGSALPALAVAGNGTIGLLFTSFDGSNLETHLVQSKDGFATHADLTLSRFSAGFPPPSGQPYVGDYEDLCAVGDTFYGTFSASNEVSRFPIAPAFVRDASRLGVVTDFSIDPFFFRTPAIGP